MTPLEDLAPRNKHRVYDLVREAGLDVSDWATSKRGIRGAAANPKYCYEWCFVQGDVVVLNLWHDPMKERNGVISSRFNIRETVRRHSSPGGQAVWRKRAQALDEAVRLGYKRRLLVRAIINSGTMRKPQDTVKSIVSYRQLDPMPWRVEEYDDSTGEALLVRGPHRGVVDQFAVETEPSAGGAPERRLTTSHSYVRDPRVREAALTRAKGLCEYCGLAGFSTTAGKVFLETHHVVPLAEGGADVLTNVAAICPNHHREAHHGAAAIQIRETLLSRIGTLA